MRAAQANHACLVLRCKKPLLSMNRDRRLTGFPLFCFAFYPLSPFAAARRNARCTRYHVCNESCHPQEAASTPQSPLNWVTISGNALQAGAECPEKLSWLNSDSFQKAESQQRRHRSAARKLRDEGASTPKCCCRERVVPVARSTIA